MADFPLHAVKLTRRSIFPLLTAPFARAEDNAYDAFGSPKDVKIQNYSGDAMEPFLTRDGRYLFFNNRNEPPEDTNLHWAERVDDLTFSYRGEIRGANSTALDAVPSMDRDGNFYFVSNRSYRETLSTIYRARFENGAITPPEIVPGVSRRVPGWVNFDAEISADGNTLYFVDGYFGRANQPQSTHLMVAVKSENGFQRLDDSAKIFEQIDDNWLTYAACTSADQLELFVTRVRRIEADAVTGIYRCARKKTREPFSRPQRIRSIEGFAEAATISPDGGSIYFHQPVSGRFVIRRAARAM